MAKVILSVEKKKDIFLHKSSIENLFISEYLPDAPGEYVKVYILGSMYAQFDEELDSRKLAISLGLSEDEVEEAWIYWASRGIIRRHKELTEDGEEIVRIDFLSLIGQLYGKAAEEPAGVDAGAAVEAAIEDSADDLYKSLDDFEYDDEEPAVKLTDTRLREIYSKYQEVTGRTVSRQETGKIADAIKVYGIKPEIFDFAIDYCADLEKYSVDYIFKVALRWTEEGCETVEDARRLLDRHSLRNSYYSQVFKQLGFNRLAAPADREIMDRWFDEMGCTIAEVLDACRASAGLREPSLRYVNKVIENRRLEAGGVNTRLEASRASEGKQTGDNSSQDGGSMVSRKVLNDYFEYIRKEGEAEQDARIAEVKAKIPEMEAIFEAESRMNQSLLSIKPGADSSDARNELKAQRLALDKRRKDLLDANGYPEDYLSRRYKCSTCRDTGYTDEGMVCSCCRERAEEAYKWIGNNKQ